MSWRLLRVQETACVRACVRACPCLACVVASPAHSCAPQTWSSCMGPGTGRAIASATCWRRPWLLPLQANAPSARSTCHKRAWLLSFLSFLQSALFLSVRRFLAPAPPSIASRVTRVERMFHATAAQLLRGGVPSPISSAGLRAAARRPAGLQLLLQNPLCESSSF